MGLLLGVSRRLPAQLLRLPLAPHLSVPLRCEEAHSRILSTLYIFPTTKCHLQYVHHRGTSAIFGNEIPNRRIAPNCFCFSGDPPRNVNIWHCIMAWKVIGFSERSSFLILQILLPLQRCFRIQERKWASSHVNMILGWDGGEPRFSEVSFLNEWQFSRKKRFLNDIYMSAWLQCLYRVRRLEDLIKN